MFSVLFVLQALQMSVDFMFSVLFVLQALQMSVDFMFSVLFGTGTHRKPNADMTVRIKLLIFLLCTGYFFAVVTENSICFDFIEYLL